MHSLSKDMAHHLASYFDNRNTFFAFSGTCRKLREYFKDKRNEIIQHGKILLVKDVTYFLTIEGSVYACGSNGNNQLGLGRECKWTHWTKIGPPNKKLIQIVPGWVNTFAFCADGLYASGNNAGGQMGLRNEHYSVGMRNIPLFGWHKIGPPRKKIKNIQLLNLTTFAECENGWYGAGKNIAKVLSYKNEFFDYQCEWRKIRHPNKTIFELRVTDYNIFMRCESGWYGRGCNENGQLGRKEPRTIDDWIPMGPDGETVLELVADEYSTFVRCNTGWFACGQIGKNALGNYGNQEELGKWVEFGLPDKKILKIVCGGMFRCAFVQYEEGWYVVGYREYFGNVPKNYCPVLPGKHWVKLEFEDKKILDVKVTWHNTYLQCEDGWYIFSTKPKDNIGVKVNDLKTWIKLGPPGKKVFKCEFTVKNTFVLCEDGWYSCGKNKSGQCGVGDTARHEEWVKVSLPVKEQTLTLRK